MTAMAGVQMPRTTSRAKLSGVKSNNAPGTENRTAASASEIAALMRPEATPPR